MKKFSKILFGCLFLMNAIPAHAEHDATYCGVPTLDRRADDGIGGKFEAVIVVQYKDVFETTKAYAGLYSLSEVEKNIVAEASKGKKQKVCVRGRWGGALYSSKLIFRIQLTSDNVQRLDFARNFNPSEEQTLYGY